MSNPFDLKPTLDFLLYISGNKDLSQKTCLNEAVRKFAFLKTLYDNGFICPENHIRLLKLQTDLNWEINSFKFADWLRYLDLKADWNNLSNNEEKLFTTDEERKRDFDKKIREENFTLLKTISVKNFLFVIADESKEEWSEIFCQKYQNIGEEKIKNLLEEKPFDVTDRVLRNNLQQLADNDLIIETKAKIDKDKKTGKFKLDFELIKTWLEKYKHDDLSEDKSNEITSSKEKFPEILIQRDFNLACFIDCFAPKSNQKRLLFASEYIINDNENINQIINVLKHNWYNNSEIKPLKLTYKKSKTSRQKDCFIYPVTFVYIKRAPYLYVIDDNSSINNSTHSLEWNWNAYRIDRIINLEVVDWNHEQILESFGDLNKREKLPIPDDVYSHYNFAWTVVGYAFWKPIKWMMLRFERHHYQEYIQNTSRHEIYQPINNIKEVNQELIDKFNPEEINALKQSIKSDLEGTFNQDKYVFCLARYYEGDTEVQHRILSWGQKVTVILPFSLKGKILAEINTTFQLYK